MGAPAYRAPEIVAIGVLGLVGAVYSFPADLWSCGVLLVELLTGKLPFPACPRDTAEQQAAICFRAPTLNTPGTNEHICPEAHSLALALLSKMAYLRPTAAEALDSPFMQSVGTATSASLPSDEAEAAAAPPHTPVLQDCLRRLRRCSFEPQCSTASSVGSSVVSWASSLVEDAGASPG